MEMFGPALDLELNHVQVMVRGMWLVANADGVHEAERTMLRDFYEGCAADAGALTDFDDLVSQDFDLAEAKEILDTAELQLAFLQSCMFLAYADGTYSDQERKVIEDTAKGLGIPVDVVKEARERVGDHLMRNVARTSNLDELQKVAKEVFE